MKRINWTALALGFCALVFAQDNDTSLYRQLDVQAVEKYVFVHAFENNKDTCLYSRQELDSLQRSTFESVNMGCFGFKDRQEMRYTYAGDELIRMDLDHADGPFSTSSYTFNDKGQPLRIVTFQHRSNDSIVNNFTYFQGKYAQPDSSIMQTVDALGDTSSVKTVARFNKRGQVVEVINLNEDREIMQEVTYEYKDSNTISSVANATFGEQGGFFQTFYEHDQFDRVIISYNNINQREEFYYLKNGLLSNVMRYNPKGELESEVIYKYEYK